MCNCSHSHCGANIHGHENKKPMDSASAVEKEEKAHTEKVTQALLPIVDDIREALIETISEKYANGERPAVEIHHHKCGDLTIKVVTMK